MSAYYKEIDQYAAQWLRNLIAAGHIAPGDVDERSIDRSRMFTQMTSSPTPNATSSPASAFGPTPAGVSAPHIRDRTYWVAHANSYGRKSRGKGRSPVGYRATAESDRSAGQLGHPDHQGLEGHAGNDSSAGWNGPSGPAPAASVPVRLANPSGNGWGQSGRNSSCGSQAH